MKDGLWLYIYHIENFKNLYKSIFNLKKKKNLTGLPICSKLQKEVLEWRLGHPV